MTTKKTAKTATTDSAQDLMKDAIKLYEEALKNGIQLQEESLQLWKDLLGKVGAPNDFQQKIEELTGGVFPDTQKKMEEILKIFQDNTSQSLELYKKAMSIYQADSWEDGQAKVQDLMESSLAAMRTNVHTVLDTNSKMMATWTDMVENATAKTF